MILWCGWCCHGTLQAPLEFVSELYQSHLVPDSDFLSVVVSLPILDERSMHSRVYFVFASHISVLIDAFRQTV